MRPRATPKTLPRPATSTGKKAALVLLLALGGLGIFALLGNWASSGCGGTASNERNGSTTLKSIAAAQFDFQSADRDWNGVKDFWRKDVAGLYAQYPATDPTKTPIKLIELSTAAADIAPVWDLASFALPSPKAGYWYRAILHENEKTAAPDRFAICAFPDTPSAGKWTYIIDEENFIYRKKLKDQRGIDLYPADPFKSGWQRID